ncbi:hypothetical protein M9Y10_017225 [Tritrichomonas musculus]|uniref:Uncharacterized protein n=1 Tax=Tritrichomonas musculus TaxID=1915356 RepID=A0ABR2HWN4_9EUKA
MNPVLIHWGEELRNLRKELQDLLSQEDKRTQIQKQIDVIESLFKNEFESLESKYMQIKIRIGFQEIKDQSSEKVQEELERFRREKEQLERQMNEIQELLKS